VSARVLAAVALAHFFADAGATLDLSNRVEVRGRSTQNVSPNPSLDLYDSLAARANLESHRWAYTLGYSVEALLPDAELGFTPLILQDLDFGATWHARRVKLEAAEYLTYGQMNQASLGVRAPVTGGVAPPTQTAQPLIQPATVTIGGTRTVLGAEDHLSGRWDLSLLLEYAVQGGLDAASQVTLPVVRGPRLTGKLSHAFPRRRTLETEALVQLSDAAPSICSPIIPPALLVDLAQPCDPSAQMGQVVEKWRQPLTRAFDVEWGAGAAAAGIRFQDRQTHTDFAGWPVAEASVSYSHIVQGEGKAAHLDLALEPFVDLRTGVIDERAQATGYLDLPTRAVSYEAVLGMARSVDSPFAQPVTSVQALASAEYLASKVVGVGGGASYSWQNQQGIGTFSIGMVFVSLTLHAPRIRF
jgi:hypothetical protein